MDLISNGIVKETASVLSKMKMQLSIDMVLLHIKKIPGGTYDIQNSRLAGAGGST